MMNFIKDAILKAENSDNKKHKIVTITKEEYLEPVKDEYIKQLTEMPIEELFDDGYNPGPTKPDGSVNFECHCVSHLVASPCGHQFRQALTCQKAATPEEQEKGACAEEFYQFIKCAMRTGCFRRKDEDDNDNQQENPLASSSSREDEK